jgi:hypothetical protein
VAVTWDARQADMQEDHGGALRADPLRDRPEILDGAFPGPLPSMSLTPSATTTTLGR